MNSPENKQERISSETVGEIRKVFPNFNPEELLPEDWKMWEAINNKTATKEDYGAYRELLAKNFGINRSTKASSSLMFADFLADRMHEILYGGIIAAGKENRANVFRQEIASMVEEEREKKTGGSGHFLKSDGSFEQNQEFRVEDLTEEDMDIFEKLKDGTITRENLRAYEEKILSLAKETPNDPAAKSRRIFYMFIANKATPVILKRDTPDLNKEKNT